MSSFAILPAAGRSVRMGSPKLLLPWQARPLIESVLAAWRASRVTAIVLVVHPEDSELASLGRAAGVDVVVPNVTQPDMKASILAGLRHVEGRYAPTSQDVWLVAPADMPLLSAEAINAVLDITSPDDQQLIIPCYQGRRGHPVRFPWNLASEVGQLAADEGLNALVARQKVLAIEVPFPGVLADVDTPEEYRRLAAEHDA